MPRVGLLSAAVIVRSLVGLLLLLVLLLTSRQQEYGKKTRKFVKNNRNAGVLHRCPPLLPQYSSIITSATVIHL